MGELVSSPTVLGAWIVHMIVALWFLERDLARHNPQIAGLMKWVWRLTVAYSGVIGLGVYYWSGRRQIPRDSSWRRGARSVAHCYAGCGAGEIAGVVITAGLLGLGTAWVAGVSFTLAYVAGFALTVGPLVQEGMSPARAVRDAFAAETVSITVMEVTAIGLDLWMAGSATVTSPLFWGSLIVSLSAGLIAAWPVNVLLIRMGVKEGMHDPRDHGGGNPGDD